MFYNINYTMKSLNVFTAFACAFMSLFGLIAIPVLIAEYNYPVLAVIVIILSALTALLFMIRSVLAYDYDSFEVSDGLLLLKGPEGPAAARIADIKEIRVTNYKYVFSSDKKFSVKRKLEIEFTAKHEIDPRIRLIADELDIPLTVTSF